MKTPIIPGVHPFDLLFHIQARMAALLLWAIIAIAHLAAAVTTLALLWAYEVKPAEALQAARDTLDGNAFAAFSVLGGSVLTLGFAYWWIARRVHRTIGSGAIFRYLTRGL